VPSGRISVHPLPHPTRELGARGRAQKASTKGEHKGRAHVVTRFHEISRGHSYTGIIVVHIWRGAQHALRFARGLKPKVRVHERRQSRGARRLFAEPCPADVTPVGTALSDGAIHTIAASVDDEARREVGHGARHARREHLCPMRQEGRHSERQGERQREQRQSERPTERHSEPQSVISRDSWRTCT